MVFGSPLYNLVGVSIAAAGLLSPLVCAILMPLSSVTVVLFSVVATRWMAGRTVKETSSAHTHPLVSIFKRASRLSATIRGSGRV